MEHVPALRGSRRSHALVALTAALSVILAGLGFSLATPANAAISAVTPSATSAITTVGTDISPITFTAIGTPDADPVTFDSTTVPAGMSLTAGVLSGSPTAPGVYEVLVTATDPGLLGGSPTVLDAPPVTITANAGLAPRHSRRS